MKCPLGIEKGSWIFPKDFDQRPLICVCAGTGIAPLKSIIQDRFKRYEEGSKKCNVFKKIVKFDSLRWTSRSFYRS